jgi:hypothetical protein
MEKGPATWWFENADQRSRFIDWIGGGLPLAGEKTKQETEKSQKEFIEWFESLSERDQKILKSKHSQ